MAIELPPQRMRVLDVLVGEENERIHPEQRTDDAEHPADGERRIDECGVAVEALARQDEQHGDEHEQCRLLVVDTLRQRGEAAEHAEGERDRPRAVQLVAEPVRGDEQRAADCAREEVRSLDDEERYDRVQHAQTPRQTRCRRGPQQHDAARERQQAHREGSQRGTEPGDAERARRDALDAGPGLAQRDDERREHERYEVVDDAIRREGRAESRDRHVVAERDEHHRLEDADAARDVAREPGHRRARVERDESEKGHVVHGQEHVEHEAGEQDVERRDRELLERERAGGQADLPGPDRERLGAMEAGTERDADEQARGGRDRAQHFRREMRDLRDFLGMDQDRERTDGVHPDGEGEHAERGDARDVSAVQAFVEVHAVAHRAARDRAGARHVRDRITAERGQRDGGIGQTLADVGERRAVVAGQEQEARRGRGEREDDLDRVERVQRLAERRIAEVLELGVDPGRGDREDDERDRGPQPGAPLAVGADGTPGGRVSFLEDGCRGRHRLSFVCSAGPPIRGRHTGFPRTPLDVRPLDCSSPARFIIAWRVIARRTFHAAGCL